MDIPDFETPMTLAEAAKALEDGAETLMKSAARLRMLGLISPQADAEIGTSASGALTLARHAESLAAFVADVDREAN